MSKRKAIVDIGLILAFWGLAIVLFFKFGAAAPGIYKQSVYKQGKQYKNAKVKPAPYANRTSDLE